MQFRFSLKMLRQFLLCSLFGTTLLVTPTSHLVDKAQAETRETVAEDLADSPTTLTGTYLSARLAQDEDNLELAAHFYAQALEKDPENPLLLERNFALTLAIGDHSTAFALADRMAAMLGHEEQTGEEATAEDGEEENEDDAAVSNRVVPMVHMALGIKAFKGKNYGSASINFENGLKILIEEPIERPGRPPHRRSLSDPRMLSASAQYGPFAVISQTILKAWSIVGQNRDKLNDALSLLAPDEESDVSQFFYALHAGLIACYARDYQKAATLLQQSLDADPSSLLTATALVNTLLKADNKQRAEEVISEFSAGSADEEDILWLKKAFSELKPIASPIRSPQDGAAEFFSTFGDALAQEGAIEGGALYLQFADYLRPNDDLTLFALGQLSERMKQNETALEKYDLIKPDSSVYRQAQRHAALALARLDHPDEAIERLKALLDGKATDIDTVKILSRVYQSEERYRDAIDILSQAIDSLPAKQDIHWSLYFLRGSAYDQVKDWPNTEKDMQSALKLFPNQPTVLNYLGYSWVDRGLHLDKAIEMIRQAVALRPFDGFFVDSLGWAHYRLKQYEEAVKFLERAVELRPEDPTITDHLGDAYWRVGRKNEAVFQWNRVKTLDPVDTLLEQVDDKIEHGLEKSK